MKLLIKLSILFFGFVFLLSSCKQSGQSNSDTGGADMIEKAEILESLEDLANPLPEPFEVYTLLEDIGAGYLGDVLNPVENAENYFSQKSKIANVGVYAADLGYAVTYNNREDINAYSKVLKSILDDLGVKIDYSILLSDNVQEKMSNKDSLINFVSDIYYETYSFLYKENSPSHSALLATGAWIEGLYIATHISEATYQNTDIVKIIYNQSESLTGLLDFLTKFEEDEMVGSLKSALTKLKAMFDETDGSLTEDQFNSITATIDTIRASLIS